MTSVPREAREALDQIHALAGGTITALPAGLDLWHCGLYQNIPFFNADMALWTMKGNGKSNYEAWARYAGKITADKAKKPFSVQLRTLNGLKALDFRKASLHDFTVEQANADHNLMKSFLRQWAMGRGHFAVVALNGDEDEVALMRPTIDAEIVSYKIL